MKLLHGPWLASLKPAGPTCEAQSTDVESARRACVGVRDFERLCQPDIVGICPDWGLIVEAKLTRTPDAEGQLLRYREACAAVWPERRWVLVMVFRNWRVGVPYWVVGPGSWERAHRMVAWHFQGA